MAEQPKPPPKKSSMVESLRAVGPYLDLGVTFVVGDWRGAPGSAPGLTDTGARPRGCCWRGQYSALLSVFIIFSQWSCASKAEQYRGSFPGVDASPARPLRPVLYCGQVPKRAGHFLFWSEGRPYAQGMDPYTQGLVAAPAHYGWPVHREAGVQKPQIIAQARTLLQQYPLHDDRFKIHLRRNN